MSLQDITSELMTVLMRSTDAEYAAAALVQFKQDVRAERDAEAVAWLVKKAREFRANGETKQADTAALLASKVERGAVRADNLRTLPADFFEPGRTYGHGPWTFRCDTVTTHPESGARTALGWFRFRKSEWTTENYGQDVWDEGSWTEVTKDGAREKDTATSGESTPADRTIYRASHDSIVMGLYTTPAAARDHCEAEERRAWATGSDPTFDWIEDEEDGVAELTAWVGGEETSTGYVITPLTVASAYDEEADE